MFKYNIPKKCCNLRQENSRRHSSGSKEIKILRECKGREKRIRVIIYPIIFFNRARNTKIATTLPRCFELLNVNKTTRERSQVD